MKTCFMKKLVILFFFLVIKTPSNAQSISCQELFEIITDYHDTRDNVITIGSSMLAKATHYTVDGDGFVIAYIKSNDYDFLGKPYIFCGISSQRWSRFKIEGMTGSWGESFHNYIREYTCNCY